MNRRLMTAVASVVALLAVLLTGLLFFQQPTTSATRVQDTDLLVTPTVVPLPSPTLTPIPEVEFQVEIQPAASENLATPIP